METMVELISPEKASEYLSRNERNRPLSARHVNRLAAAMSRGEWSLNGESIKFGENDVLLDGQHRLHAIALAGVPVRSLVVRGLNGNAFDTVDTGRNRVAGDVLAILGYQNVQTIAAAARIVVAHERGDVYRCFDGSVTNRMIVECLRERPDIDQMAHKHIGVRLYPRGYQIGLSYIFGEKTGRDSEIAEFWERFDDGLGLTSLSPIWHLRERMIQHNAAKGGKQLNRKMVLACGIRCMDVYLAGGDMRLLRISKNDLPQIG